MENNINVLVVVIACFVCYWLGKRDRRKKPVERKLITEPMIKINFNPVKVRWEWSRLNPKTRTWEWLDVEATIEEIGKYKDVLLSEKEGLNILYGRIGENNNG